MSTSRPTSRVKRIACWDARDKFYECLDKNGFFLETLPKPKTYQEALEIDPKVLSDPQHPVNNIENADKMISTFNEADRKQYTSCREARKGFEKNCLTSWVCIYFLHF